jgi:excisionase family DNA binding protein
MWIKTGDSFDGVASPNTMQGMVVASPDTKWLTVSEAAELAGCSTGWIRLLLGRGDLEGWKAGKRAWMVSSDDAVRLRGTLTDRSVGKRGGKASHPKRRKSR